MKKYFSVALVLSMIIVMGATMTETPQQETYFKNLKVLPKNIADEKLDSVMAYWSVSLGVKCNFCHAMNADTTKKRLDFASDANEHKEVARYMHKMTVDINEKFFSQVHSDQPDTLHAVMCYTCHRGSPHVDANSFLSIIDSTLQSPKKK